MVSPSTACVSILFGCALFFAALPANAQTQLWLRHDGTDGWDHAARAVSDGVGGVFVAGSSGAVEPEYEVSVSRYDSAGQRLWIHNDFVGQYNEVFAAAPNESNGAFVGGWAWFGSYPWSGDFNGWVGRVTPNGNFVVLKQFGTPRDDAVRAVASDGTGGVFVCWTAYGVSGAATHSLVRLTGAGAQLWSNALADSANCASSDGAGGVFIAGSVDSGGSSPDSIWFARYAADGHPIWRRQLASGVQDRVFAVANDGSNGAWLCGATNGDLAGPNLGSWDAWLARYDDAGLQLTLQQVGTSAHDYATALTRDAAGGVLLSGTTYGDFGGANAGAADAWVGRFDAQGQPYWLRQLGSVDDDQCNGAASDGVGGVFLVGTTLGDLGGANAGEEDAWLARYEGGAPIAFCTAGTTTNGCVPSIHASGQASATAAAGFTITIDEVEGQKLGLLFYGVDNTGWTPPPWSPTSTSFRCLRGPTQRTGVSDSGGLAGACDGTLTLDWNSFRAAHPAALGQPFLAGQRVYTQGWFRDPPAPRTTNLSDGLQFVLSP